MAGRNWSGPWPRTPGRIVGLGFILLYQYTLSGFVGAILGALLLIWIWQTYVQR